jgi:hypothetical protein
MICTRGIIQSRPPPRGDDRAGHRSMGRGSAGAVATVDRATRLIRTAGVRPLLLPVKRAVLEGSPLQKGYSLAISRSCTDGIGRGGRKWYGPWSSTHGRDVRRASERHERVVELIACPA